MADEQNGAADAQPKPPRMQVLGQYIRDLSFENIAIQKGVKVDGAAEVSVAVALDVNKRGENLYEVIIKLKAESKSGEQAIFILELEYAGQFRVENVPESQLHPFLMIECPRMVFPYVRRIVGDVSRDGGFPPLNLENIDFLALYQQEITRRKASQESEGKTLS